MKISEFVAQNSHEYACMDYVLLDDIIDLQHQEVPEEEDKNINDCRVVDMNKYEYLAYLELNEPSQESIDLESEEVQKALDKINAQKYGYDNDDKFVVIFAHIA